MTKKYEPSEQMIKKIKSLLYEGNPKCSLENEKEIREEIKKQYILADVRRISSFTLYYRVLNYLYEKRPKSKNIHGKIAGKRNNEFKRNSKLSLLKDPAMKFAIERTNAAQPRFMSLSTNMPLGSRIALLTKIPSTEIEKVEPSDVDRRNWGI